MILSRKKNLKPVSVSIDRLWKQFGTQMVLKDISLTVDPGEIFVIMGPSGSGKSVLLKNIIGLETPTKGSVHIDKLDASNPTTHQEIVTTYVFQSGALFQSMTVYDNLALYSREHELYTEDELADKVYGILKMLSLESAAEKSPAELSGGMKKRVAIARALMMEPQLLLYDEPTSELDPIMGANIIEIIATLKEELGVTSIVVSHDPFLAKSVGNRIALMFNGKIHTLDKAEIVLNDPDPIVQNFFNPKIDLKNPRFKQSRTSKD